MKTNALLLSAILLFVFSACNSNKQPASAETSSATSSGFAKDSIQFLTAVKGLEKCCLFFIEQDAIELTETGLPVELSAEAENDFTEIPVGGSVSAMASQIDRLDEDEVPPFVRVHVLKKDEVKGERPSASLLMFYFDSEASAKDWVNKRDETPDDSVIYFKPKGILWASGNKAYMVETFHTPERDYVNQLKAELIRAL